MSNETYSFDDPIVNEIIGSNYDHDPELAQRIRDEITGVGGDNRPVFNGENPVFSLGGGGSDAPQPNLQDLAAAFPGLAHVLDGLQSQSSEVSPIWQRVEQTLAAPTVSEEPSTAWADALRSPAPTGYNDRGWENLYMTRPSDAVRDGADAVNYGDKSLPGQTIEQSPMGWLNKDSADIPKPGSFDFVNALKEKLGTLGDWAGDKANQNLLKLLIGGGLGVASYQDAKARNARLEADYERQRAKEDWVNRPLRNIGPMATRNAGGLNQVRR
jgi:hypothetical protein